MTEVEVECASGNTFSRQRSRLSALVHCTISTSEVHTSSEVAENHLTILSSFSLPYEWSILSDVNWVLQFTLHCVEWSFTISSYLAWVVSEYKAYRSGVSSNFRWSIVVSWVNNCIVDSTYITLWILISFRNNLSWSTANYIVLTSFGQLNRTLECSKWAIDFVASSIDACKVNLIKVSILVKNVLQVFSSSLIILSKFSTNHVVSISIVEECLSSSKSCSYALGVRQVVVECFNSLVQLIKLSLSSLTCSKFSSSLFELFTEVSINLRSSAHQFTIFRWKFLNQASSRPDVHFSSTEVATVVSGATCTEHSLSSCQLNVLVATIKMDKCNTYAIRQVVATFTRTFDRVSIADISITLECPVAIVSILSYSSCAVKVVRTINSELSGEVVTSYTLSNLYINVAWSGLVELSNQEVVVSDRRSKSTTTP